MQLRSLGHTQCAWWRRGPGRTRVAPRASAEAACLDQAVVPCERQEVNLTLAMRMQVRRRCAAARARAMHARLGPGRAWLAPAAPALLCAPRPCAPAQEPVLRAKLKAHSAPLTAALVIVDAPGIKEIATASLDKTLATWHIEVGPGGAGGVGGGGGGPRMRVCGRTWSGAVGARQADGI